MAAPLLIGAGAGLVSAALFASAATATPLAGLLFYLAPLPVALAGLGWGWTAAAVAALAGTIVAGAVLGIATGLIFALAIGAPLAVLCYLVLLSRQVALPEGAAAEAVALEWYPLGRIVGWAAVMAGGLAALMVLMLGYDTETYSQSIRSVLEHSALKTLDQDGSIINESTIGNLSAVLARALPAAFAIVWQSIALFNVWLAGVIVEASGRALRPWPKLDALELPNSIFLAFTASLVASFLPGLAGLLATAFAGAFLFAYVLQGLAVLHAFTRGMPFRAALLAAVYLGMLVLGWVAVAVAILGLSEPMLRLRERAAARGQPPRND